MSKVRETDIGSYYAGVAGAMNENLEKLISIFEEKSIQDFSIPKGIISDSEDMFSLALNRFRNPQNPPAAIAHYRLVADVLGVTLSKDMYSREEFIPTVRKLLELTRDLTNPILILEHLKEDYKLLKDFFGNLYRLSEQNRYDKSVAGVSGGYSCLF